ncbi:MULTISPECIES: fumarylacetoacetate hydrolase family protein [Pseudomonas]|jgi:2-keto-4-pentenoate hydratase/2-oxohepta-3-ene-1,7-dioic acid hydratase in catechol pathway|uniref:fumarylacetoacetate hydrolase family protein n=1 Tax=Pseudomonas TaxID=286 RepID=UPI0007187707|nr:MULTISPECIES: fumarylacetoacetate hydrolase family protein [Pseudomonas]KSW22445.1 5-carboxymethyl-2-hydroxymuconate isomerase [Pseudomonas sp. ADP]AMO77153.1 Ureidoglycolate lyase [Pseudomonas citronellolis]KRV78270.1 5-carboxymethyl-2-hydroxymuconate isomerase [Pseudomonas citronellolis]KRW79862.1 5-carboxymethyl-2-hydroxymuconate isomerase [Pseudomonas citronellolis]OBP12377.1 5-carboxymethyl-2-hydroxymuconate isomerase [Pseudomonas sp. EGD-AKN5]
MKLCTFKTPGGLVGVGIVSGEGIIRVADHLSAAPRDMAGLIGEWQLWQEPLQRLAQLQKADFALDEVTLLAPVPRPGKILGIGLNYADHVAESGMATPADQLWFAMMNTAANGPYAPIDLPRVSEQLDYEAEMVFVIGKRCRHVSREQAREAIFGYCVGNDVSVRDWQLRTSQFVLGKSFDGHAPFGPWLVTPDELGNPHELGIRCFVNDEKRQDSNTRELIFDCYQQVEHLSKVMTLEPGDVIFSGTPGGVGVGFKPPRWLREGDRVRVEIDGLGAIENIVRAERAAGDGHAR